MGSTLPNVDELADEFLNRRRKGERPTIDEYVAEWPQLEDSIREVFPALIAMESLKRDWEQTQHSQPQKSSVPVERIGDYRLIREIGRGGMGIVYEAVQESLGRHVAIKLLPQHALADPTYVRRLHREARTAAALHHSNIVPVFGVGEEEGYHYIVMQLISGAPLDRVISLLRQPAGNELAQSISSDSDTTLSDGALGLIIEQASAETPTEINGSVLQGMLDAPNTMLNGISRITDQTSNTNPDAAQPSQSAAREPEDAAKKSDEASLPPVPNEYWRLVARLGAQVAKAIHHAHENGTLHRDIKPGNILMDTRGGIWITDFGLAHATDGSNVSHSSRMAGTLRYMAPEQLDGKSTEASDVYSLGLTLYELATRHPAFIEASRAEVIRQITQSRPTAPRSLCPEMPRDLETIILKAISRTPGDRYRTAAALADDLSRFRDDQPISARRVSILERFRRWCRHNPQLAISTTTSLLLLIAVAAFSFVGYAREARERQRTQAILNVSLDSLESVFNRYVPDDAVMAGNALSDGSIGATVTSVALSSEAAAMLEDLLPAFDQISQQFGDDTTIRLRAAEANRHVGDIHASLLNGDDAIAAYKEAMQRYEELDSAEDGRVIRSGIQLRIGNVFSQQGNLTGAADAYAAAIEILTGKEARTPQEVESSGLSSDERFQLARICYQLGRRATAPLYSEEGGGPPRPPNESVFGPNLGPGRNSPRLSEIYGGPPSRHVNKSKRSWLRRAIAELAPADGETSLPEHRYLTALCQRDLSTDFSETDLADATAELKSLVDVYGDTDRYRHQLAVTYAAMDINDAINSDVDVALRRLNQAHKQIEQLIAMKPDVAAYQLTGAQVNHRLSMLQEAAAFQASDRIERDLVSDEAIIHARRALELQWQASGDRKLKSEDATWLGRFTNSLAKLLMERARPDQAGDTLSDTIRQLTDRKKETLSHDQSARYQQEVSIMEDHLQRISNRRRPGPP